MQVRKGPGSPCPNDMTYLCQEGVARERLPPHWEWCLHRGLDHLHILHGSDLTVVSYYSSMGYFSTRFIRRLDTAPYSSSHNNHPTNARTTKSPSPCYQQAPWPFSRRDGVGDETSADLVHECEEEYMETDVGPCMCTAPPSAPPGAPAASAAATTPASAAATLQQQQQQQQQQQLVLCQTVAASAA
eukprot:scaffold610_cov67-Skeletonema_dohrnii-CCMP3373.AAC.1